MDKKIKAKVTQLLNGTTNLVLELLISIPASLIREYCQLYSFEYFRPTMLVVTQYPFTPSLTLQPWSFLAPLAGRYDHVTKVQPMGFKQKRQVKLWPCPYKKEEVPSISCCLFALAGM